MSFFVSDSLKGKIKIEEDDKIDYDELYFISNDQKYEVLNFTITSKKFKFQFKTNKQSIPFFLKGICLGNINLGIETINLKNIKLRYVESILESNRQNKYILTLHSVLEEHNV